MADAVDSKSTGDLPVGVQVPSPAPRKANKNATTGGGAFLFVICENF